MRLTINLATRIYINTRRLNFFIAGAAILLTLLLLFNIGNVATDFGEIRRLTKETAALEGKARSAKSDVIPEKEYQTLLTRIRFANGIIEKKTFNWLALLDKLEVVVPDGIALASIEPNPKDGVLKLAGIAKSFGSLRKFMENLEDSKYFTEVYLVSQAETQVLAGQKGINFTVTAKALYR
jgi:type IV pilus assembly protein PilN